MFLLLCLYDEIYANELCSDWLLCTASRSRVSEVKTLQLGRVDVNGCRSVYVKVFQWVIFPDGTNTVDAFTCKIII